MKDRRSEGSKQEYDFDLEKSIWDWLHNPEVKGYVAAIRDEFLKNHPQTEDKEAIIEYVYNEIVKRFPNLHSVPPKYVRNVLRLSFMKIF